MSGMDEINDIQLIKEVEKHRSLYVRQSIGYRNMTVRSEAWAEIALKLQVDEESCKRRWRNIRDRFVKICWKNISGDIKDDKDIKNEKQWHLLPYLKFLREVYNSDEVTDVADDHFEKNEFTCLTTAEELIAEIKKHKAIYAKNSHEYKNKQNRLEAWSKISEALNVDASICQKRWRSLRDRYAKIRYDDNEAANWYLLPHLEFLKEHRTTRKPAQNNCMEQEISLHDYQQSYQKRSNRNVYEMVGDILDRITDITAHKSEDDMAEVSNENVIFLKMLNEKLEQINRDKQDDAKMFVLNYLHKLTK